MFPRHAVVHGWTTDHADFIQDHALPRPGACRYLHATDPQTCNFITQGDPMLFDAVIVGGGPAGLSAALALGRARRRVLLCDAGPRRNAAATHVHNFVTRDGTPP